LLPRLAWQGLWQPNKQRNNGKRTSNEMTEELSTPAPPTACRVGCGACCIAPSITSPIPGMPNGKPAGVRCIQLTADNRCTLFGLPERPAVCLGLMPSPEMCGSSDQEAFRYLAQLEVLTQPRRK
jgi:hypothetical protein